ncbi:HNH endonuclease family protein [Kitasatospora sp. NBC_00240]|uniref:HNH endonuclease family protein n=1 Tax=Kitasatospora sp. NBC_00240 TaxID=2903567 RepID=UPI00225022DE|nr:HNH endonuclease family protein [Kitasatospora sp. NBC_00240]MCX5215689.1 HNH endonuclease family protein [Kitasatospora sp. NBC_00240]
MTVRLTRCATMMVLATAAAALSAACTLAGANVGPAGSASRGTAAAADAELDRLPVKGRAPKAGYSRDQFGPAWSDESSAPMSGNSCSTRDDVLARDLVNPVREGRCTVVSGVLNDPYTGKTIAFKRGPGSSLAVQIDHVVALSDAWQKGAQQLSAADRLNLANDPLNLVATDGPTNGAKGDGDAATWLPPSGEIRCGYVSRQIAVKAKYRLWVTEAEQAAMRRVLAQCPGPALPG